jgi:glycine hydroxymethyltransferase
MHIIAAKAVCFGEAMRPEFRDYQRRVVENARTLAQGLAQEGLRIVSGGTDNHLMLVDLSPLEITGQAAEEALGRVNIWVNRNTIPFDPRPPRVTSGLRLGTPAVTSRGMGPQEMRRIATMIGRVLNHMGDPKVEAEVREEVGELTSRFPVPGLDL